MGLAESTNQNSGASAGGDFIGAYGNVADNINPIFDDNGRDNGDGVAAGGDQLDLGSVLDELRRKRDAKNKNLGDNGGDGDDDDRGSDDDSDGEELRLGKLHRDRLKRGAIEEHDDVRGRANEHDIYIEGDAVPLAQLRLRDEASAIDNGDENIRWYLSDDIGKLDVFQVLPMAQGVICTVPVNAVGRHIKAVCFITVTDYRGKGYEATVGQAVDPITGEAVQSGKPIIGAVSATIGPIKLPEDWYMRYKEILHTQPIESDPLTVNVEYDSANHSNVIFTVDSDRLAFRGLPKSFPLQKSASHHSIPLSSTLVKFIAGAQPTLSIKMSKNPQKVLITCPDEPLSKLLFIWGFIMVRQALIADPDARCEIDELLQHWLERKRHHDLIK